VSFAVSQYRSSQVQTASPARVIVQFYDGALKFLKLATEALEARNYAAKGMYLSRAHAIVDELRLNLEPSKAPELCAELDRLYVFVLDRITQANVKTDAKLLVPATKVLEQLRAAWVQVADEGTGVRVLNAP
jgi:flagellar protein FliS